MAANNGNGTNETEEKEETLTYVNYLKVDTLLSCQQLRCPKFGKYEHDEHLFIVIHQAYELWFKQIIHELDSICMILKKNPFDEKDQLMMNTRMERILLIQKLLIDQVYIIETMSPLSFFNFREYLYPASGFQSYQFRLVEIKIGLRRDDRVEYQKKTYSLHYDKEQQKEFALAEAEPSLQLLVEQWLERFQGREDFWMKFLKKVKKMLGDRLATAEAAQGKKQKTLLESHESSKNLYANIQTDESYRRLLDKGKARLSYEALQGALMISHYRHEVRFQGAYQFLKKLLDMDSLINQWRYHHVLMVQRMIGAKPGTAGSSGYDYLMSTINDKYKVFLDLFNLSNYFLPEEYVPKLSEDQPED